MKAPVKKKRSEPPPESAAAVQTTGSGEISGGMATHTARTSRADLLATLARAPAMRKRLKDVAALDPVSFEHVHEAAFPVLAALLAREAASSRCWIVCPDVRSQEAVHNVLAHWFPEALFYPELDAAVVEGAMPDPETAAERLSLIQKLGRGEGQIIVLTRRCIDDPVPAPEEIRGLEVTIQRGKRLDREALIHKLNDAGYENVSHVAQRGQFAVRGGILDIFSFQSALPLRVELFDDEIESLRLFDIDEQTSVQQVDQHTILLGEVEHRSWTLQSYIKPDDLTVDANANWFAARVRIMESSESSTTEDYSTAFHEHGLGEFNAGDFVVDEAKREGFFRQLTEWRVQKWQVFVFCNNEGEIERLHDLIPAVESDPLHFLVGPVSRGFTFPAGKVAVLSDAELFGRYRNTRSRRLALRRVQEAKNRSHIDFSELVEGELVVHLEHGIARFEGMRQLPRGDAEDAPPEEVLILEFADNARLYVPLEQSSLVARYVGVGKKSPTLSSLGDAKWARAKKSAEKAVFDYASQLLQMHAERETLKGFACPPDNKWQQEFEASFLYKETPDQLTSIAAAKADMESERPMDRLICGDVGFGKTEVAIRAAFKAVMAGKQVAFLVPTTVLAEQHWRNLRERMSDYPITVDLLSRFRTGGQQRATVAAIREGTVDIVVGTHRLISRDIEFKNLGLVIIDEEQRFGVLHKERFKEMFRLVDMLTLSATPIPRTLYLSLMGARDMSTIETAPTNRIPVETVICPYDERVIKEAIKRELERQGQVYFLHNRVESIQRTAQRLEELVPGARIVVGHGQMDEHELEEVMRKFVAAEADILVSTTIIESGLDIPNANTIIIDRADRFGLADLYQLRGRVGRAQHKAYAYLMLPRHLMTVGEARRRINAIKQYGSLGAGFKIAMRDLEIRGAGNILGTQQSGHIINVGFDLYCTLLKHAVGKLKGERTRLRLDIALNIDFVVQREADFIRNPADKAGAFLPTAYVGESQARIQAYRRLNEATSQESLDTLRKNWRDRFGRLPQPVENLLILNEIKLAAIARKFTAVEVREEKLMLTRAGDYVLLGGKFPRLTGPNPDKKLRDLLAMLRAL